MPNITVELAEGLEADGVFIGWSLHWKQRVTSKIVDLARMRGLSVHGGMPKDYFWAFSVGVDSVNSANTVRNQNYGRIAELERRISEQKRVNQFLG